MLFLFIVNCYLFNGKISGVKKERRDETIVEAMKIPFNSFYIYCMLYGLLDIKFKDLFNPKAIID